MKQIGLLLLFVGTCYCRIDFYDRPRNFSIELLYYTQLETEGHVVISPFGIWTLMTGVALGATGNSYNELSRAFILPKSQETLVKGYKDLTAAVLQNNNNGVRLTSKNYVLLDNDFTIYPAFRGAIQKDYGASVKVLDFNNPSTAQISNLYIEKSSGVKNVYRADDFVDARMLLTNVITFKGLWKSPFNKSDTLVEKFYDEEENLIGEVNMMFQRAQFPYSNIGALRSTAIELPYGTDGKYSMLVILPDRKMKISRVYKALATVSLKDIFKQLEEDVEEYGLTDIEVKLPRFRINTNVVMNKPLNNMGVYDIFQPDLASFKRITSASIYVSSIVHTADIEVTESGTVASAITTATFADRMSTPSFTANKPFIYFIVEKSTTTVIFGGIYSKPTVY